MSAAITCASCKRPLRVPENVLGQLVQCPLCLDEFVARADPAAEAAARAVEAPSKRALVQPQPVAVPFQDDEVTAVEEFEEAAEWVEPAVEATPQRKSARVPAPAKALVFSVLVARDPDRVLRGRMEAELTAEGLHLRKPRQTPAFAPVGGRALYLGANRLVVTVEGREVELTVVKPWTSVYHLARDAAGFLSGKGDFPNGRAYNVPWYLYALPPAFVALPFAACPLGLLTDGCGGVFLWCLIAAVLGGAAFAVVIQPRLIPRTRLIGAGSLAGLGAAIYLIAIPLTPAYTVDPARWRTYSPASGDFNVLMPGGPGVLSNGDAQDHVLIMANPDLSFCIHVAPAPPADNPFAFQPVNSVNNQAVNDIKNRHQNAYAYPNNLVIQVEWDASQSGQSYHEIVCQRTLGYNDFGLTLKETCVVRVYVANGKIFAPSMRGPRVRADAPDVLKFLNSFRTKAANNIKAP